MSVILDKVSRWLHKRNKNWLCIICGATRSGKSWSALTIGERLDPSFTVDRVVFKAKGFMEAIDDAKRGQVIIWDEAGVGIPAREWYSMSNKAINYVFQEFGRLGLAVILTTPSFDFIDSQTRKLFHNYIETVYMDEHRGFVSTKYMDITYSPRFGKVYFQYPRIGGVKFTRFKIPKPSKEIREAYESKKTIFSKNLRTGVSDDIRFIQKKTAQRRLTDEQIQTELKKLEERPTYAEIQRKFSIGKDRAYFNIMKVFGKAKRGRRPDK